MVGSPSRKPLAAWRVSGSPRRKRSRFGSNGHRRLDLDLVGKTLNELFRVELRCRDLQPRPFYRAAGDAEKLVRRDGLDGRVDHEENAALTWVGGNNLEVRELDRPVGLAVAVGD